MKKRAVCSLAVTAALASVFAFSACNDSVTWDYEAPAFGTNADVTVSVKAKKTDGAEGKISDTLFGVFLEDINYAGYYLDNDLILNGNFDARTKEGTYGWTALNNTTQTLLSDTNGILAGTAEYGAKRVNPNYVKVTVSSAGAGGVRNAGYGNILPMAMQEGTNYKFSAFIKSPDKEFTMGVRVTDGTDDYLSGEITVQQSGEWIKYTRSFAASGTKANGLRFELSIPASTEVFIDGVSLETEDSTIGIKNTAYKAIKDLAPKFVRFPGGCIIEGDYQSGDDCAYDWKNSIGAVQNGNNAGDDTVPAFTYKLNDGSSTESVTTYGEEVTRKANPDLWSGHESYYYDLNYGLGFYDYFMLCDSIGASAVPVVNCGLSCMGGVPVGSYKTQPLAGRHNLKIADFIQDAIDLIEFAKGGTNTKWGKIRELMGHAEPFEMNYIGIGNEQWGTYYTNYYEKFLENEAFMTALETYDIKPIVGNGVAFTDCERPNASGKLSGGMAKTAATTYLSSNNKPDRKISTVSEYGVVDQHYYVSYDTLLENTQMYDSYLRSYTDEENYYEVFVGEYSANGGVTTKGFGKYVNNEWITALSEAAMMTGYERNGDVIKLAAYAPMFGTACNVGASMAINQWGTDMMYFTNTELVLSTNYYVQQLFMKNQGAYRITEGNHGIEWHNDLSPTFELAADEAGSDAVKTVNKLYYVASLAENGDVIVKIVNVSGDTIKADFDISDFSFKGNADVTELQCDDRTAKNTLTETNVEPRSFTIGAFSGSAFGYELKPYSVMSFTVHAK